MRGADRLTRRRVGPSAERESRRPSERTATEFAPFTADSSAQTVKGSVGLRTAEGGFD